MTDPRLAPYRDAVFELRHNGELVGHLTTQIWSMRSLPALHLKRDQLWSQITWLDGTKERPEEDYGPDWPTLTELESGTYDPTYGDYSDLQATPLTGPARDTLWKTLGPPE
ncbi:hypothetical protein HPO96_25350 [Kribbella sandramycini]|uniref:Uncharacterized protein n=1 Tax=Kribbella sandramycini TaxID=60450 RepID=A0A7Y4P0V9_9ACTN|nr:hypothetical protein [Kribbella sandramycini]MBB6571014.1 hypothetical protein [Kribbella sandramycini]NOL43577.1 hypothetical protein [Kribbella sandramycini]